MRLWTPKFIGSLVVVAIFFFDAFALGPDPVTGAARHVLPGADTGVASFIFLLVLLYAISHIGGWTLAKFRHWRTGGESGAPPATTRPHDPRQRRRQH